MFNFTGVSRSPRKANTAVWSLIPGALRQKDRRIKKEKYNGDHYSSHRENERAGHQFDPHGTMLVVAPVCKSHFRVRDPRENVAGLRENAGSRPHIVARAMLGYLSFRSVTCKAGDSTASRIPRSFALL